jgi:hypothetical protein
MSLFFKYFLAVFLVCLSVCLSQLISMMPFTLLKPLPISILLVYGAKMSPSKRLQFILALIGDVLLLGWDENNNNKSLFFFSGIGFFAMSHIVHCRHLLGRISLRKISFCEEHFNGMLLLATVMWIFWSMILSVIVETQPPEIVFGVIGYTSVLTLTLALSWQLFTESPFSMRVFNHFIGVVLFCASDSLLSLVHFTSMVEPMSVIVPILTSGYLFLYFMAQWLIYSNQI